MPDTSLQKPTTFVPRAALVYVTSESAAFYQTALGIQLFPSKKLLLAQNVILKTRTEVLSEF
jgi:hypothetical protein